MPIKPYDLAFFLYFDYLWTLFVISYKTLQALMLITNPMSTVESRFWCCVTLFSVGLTIFYEWNKKGKYGQHSALKRYKNLMNHLPSILVEKMCISVDTECDDLILEIRLQNNIQDSSETFEIQKLDTIEISSYRGIFQRNRVTQNSAITLLSFVFLLWDNLIICSYKKWSWNCFDGSTIR